MASTRRRRLPRGTLTPVRPNAGVQTDYRRRLERAVDEMHASVLYWTTAAYRAGDHDLAADAAADDVHLAVRRLTRRWTGNFGRLAPKLAAAFADDATDHSDAALKAALKAAGMAVELKLTDAARNVVKASVAENVSLIKSVAAQHMADVEGIVARSVAQGRDLRSLTAALEDRYQVTRKRAAFIARDQNNKATAAVQRVRFGEIGIEKALWMHSHAGKHPRPSHVAFDGKEYSVRDGAIIDGRVCWPGTELNCRCVSRPILPSLRAG